MKSGIARGPADVDEKVAAFYPAQLLQTLQETRHSGRPLRIVRGETLEHPNAPHPLGRLLSARRRGPRRYSKPRYDVSAPHPTTSRVADSEARAGLHD